LLLLLSTLQVPLRAGDGELAVSLIDTYLVLFRAAVSTATAAAAAAASGVSRKGGKLSGSQRRKLQQQRKSGGARGSAAPGPGAAGGGGGAAAAAQAVSAAAVEGRLMAALLTGIHRAFPYTESPAQRAAVEAHADTLFGLVHAGGAQGFSTALRALMVLQQVAAARLATAAAVGAEGGGEEGAAGAAAAAESFVSRFYRALYAKVAVPDLTAAGSAKHALFLNLVFKAAKSDRLPGRVRAVLKRLVQVRRGVPVARAHGVS
jgi:ribosome biogenesis protein MAK21